MTREELERRLAAADAHVREAAARLEESEQRLAALEDQRAEIAGEAAIARRAITDFAEVVERTRAELAALQVLEVEQALESAIQSRDDAVRGAGSALQTAVDLVDGLDARRAAVAELKRALDELAPHPTREVPEEPDVLEEPWQRVVALVRAQLDEQLEVDIVESAARSHLPSAIDELPQHLRELARQRRNALLRERQAAMRERHH